MLLPALQSSSVGSVTSSPSWARSVSAHIYKLIVRNVSMRQHVFHMSLISLQLAETTKSKVFYFDICLLARCRLRVFFFSHHNTKFLCQDHVRQKFESFSTQHSLLPDFFVSEFSGREGATATILSTHTPSTRILHPASRRVSRRKAAPPLLSICHGTS